MPNSKDAPSLLGGVNCPRNNQRRKQKNSTVKNGYQPLEPRKLLASLVGDFVDDFNSGVGSNWGYYWSDTGSLSDSDSFESLEPSVNNLPTDEVFTLEGNPLSNTSSTNQLNLSRGGGSPGEVDQFAIAGFTIDESGYYTIGDSFLSVANANSDGIEFRVFVDDGPWLNDGAVNVTGDSRSYFDTELGFLAAGSEVFVALGAGELAADDAFTTDFSIFRHEDREIIVDPSQGTSASIWEHVVEHSGLYGIRNTTTLTNTVNTGASVNGLPVLKDSLSNDYVQLDGSLSYLTKGDVITVKTSGQAALNSFEVVRVVQRAAPDLSFVQDVDNHLVIDVPLPDNQVSAFDRIQQAIFRARFERGLQIQATQQDGIERSVEIRLSPGTYHLDYTDGDRSSEHFFQIFNNQNNTNDNDWVINGNGATITTNDVTRGLFSISVSQNIIIRDLTFDYAEFSSSAAGDFYKPVGFTQGEILSINPNTNSIVIEVDTAEFLAPDDSIPDRFFDDQQTMPEHRFLPEDPNNSQRFWGFPVRDDSGRVADNVETIYPTRDATFVSGDGRYERYEIEFNFRDISSDEFSIGQTYVLQRRESPPAFRLTDSDNVTIQRVTAYSAPGVFVTSRGGELNNFLDSHVMIRPTTGLATSTRVTSINGDALHVQSDRDGFWVEDSTFNGVSDDITNFYSLPAAVHSIDGGGFELNLGEIVGTAETDFSVRSLYEVGDVLIFVDPQEGTVITEARITEVVPQGRARFIVTFDQPVTGVTLRGGGNDTMVFNTSINKGFVVQDSEFTNSRRFGNFLMANNVDLVDNVYSGLPDQAIAGHSELDFPLGPYPRNVLVQGNEFSDIGFSRQAQTRPYYFGAVAFFVDRLGDTTATTGVVSGVPDGVYEVENIQIRDNVFIDWEQRAIVVRSAQRVTIADNHIFAPNATDFNDQDRALLIENAINVSLENNVFDQNLEPVLLGDVNLDGTVSFSDILPFISLLKSREYQAEADVNQDGTVNFRDIAPFVDVLRG